MKFTLTRRDLNIQMCLKKRKKIIALLHFPSFPSSPLLTCDRGATFSQGWHCCRDKMNCLIVGIVYLYACARTLRPREHEMSDEHVISIASWHLVPDGAKSSGASWGEGGERAAGGGHLGEKGGEGGDIGFTAPQSVTSPTAPPSRCHEMALVEWVRIEATAGSCESIL